MELQPPVKIDDFVAGGKIELSLRHYLELVMANNTDVQLQLISVEIPRYNILSAFGVWDPTAQASFLHHPLHQPAHQRRAGAEYHRAVEEPHPAV